MRIHNPRCVADMKNPLCHWYIRIYKKTIHMDNKIVRKTNITVNKGFKAQFVEEVEARFIEWGCSEYRLSFPFDGVGSSKPWNSDIKQLDIYYNDNAKFKEWSDDYVFVLVIKVEKDFKSVCI